jgi:opacity protein-like surface antigen
MRRTRLVLSIALIAAIALASLALAATTSTVSDFNASHGKFTFQLKQSGKRFEVIAFTLACTSESYAEAKPKVPVKGSGAFSYSGPGSLVTKTSTTKTTFKASGRINFGKARTLSSAKSASAKVSITTPGCRSFLGKLRGYVIPLASTG